MKPENTAVPKLSADEYETGRRVRATTGSWNGTALSFAYQWFRCDRDGGDCTAIHGATRRTYELGEATAGKTVRVVVTASNTAGESAAYSAASDVVRLPPAEVKVDLPAAPASSPGACACGSSSNTRSGSRSRSCSPAKGTSSDGGAGACATATGSARAARTRFRRAMRGGRQPTRS